MVPKSVSETHPLRKQICCAVDSELTHNRVQDITGRRGQVLEQAIKVHGSGLKGSLHAIQADISSREDLQKIVSQISEGYLNMLIK